MKKKIAVASAILYCLVIFIACSEKQSISSSQTEAPSSSQTNVLIDTSKYQNNLTGLMESGNPLLRPIAISIENNHRALPHHGISQASLTYEMPVEGGITRLMCVFDDIDSLPEMVGSVRSGRDQFLQQAIPLAAFYVQAGGSTFSKEMIIEYGWQNKTIDYTNAKSIAYWQDDAKKQAEYSMEHNLFTNGEYLTTTAENLGLSLEIEKLEDRRAPIFNFTAPNETRILETGDANSAYLAFSSTYKAAFIYNSTANQYEKYQNGSALLDENNKQAIAYTNVFLLFTEITTYGETPIKSINFYTNGLGYYLNGGKYEKVRWIKGKPQDPLRIFYADGSEREMLINPGSSYIAFADYSAYESVKINRKEEILEMIKTSL